MARASGTPIQFLWGNTEFSRDESLRVSHRVQINDVEVTRLRFPAREGADEEEPLTFEYIVGLPRGLDLSTKLETGSEATEVHSSSRIGVRESWPAAYRTGLQLQRTALTVNAEEQRPDARMLPRLD